MAIAMAYPTCGSYDIAKNGTTHRGKLHSPTPRDDVHGQRQTLSRP